MERGGGRGGEMERGGGRGKRGEMGRREEGEVKWRARGEDRGRGEMGRGEEGEEER